MDGYPVHRWRVAAENVTKGHAGLLNAGAAPKWEGMVMMTTAAEGRARQVMPGNPAFQRPWWPQPTMFSRIASTSPWSILPSWTR